MRLILDTNVLLSALLSARGAPAKLLAAWEQRLFALVVSPEFLVELRSVLQRPFFRTRVRESDAELLIATLHDLGLWYLNVPPSGGAPDPKDNFLLAVAAASKADFLVTGDKSLLALKRHGAAEIVTPAFMAEHLKRSLPES
jgi:putative PIN family toxin of toxin-antitoxin system